MTKLNEPQKTAISYWQTAISLYIYLPAI